MGHPRFKDSQGLKSGVGGGTDRAKTFSTASLGDCYRCIGEGLLNLGFSGRRHPTIHNLETFSIAVALVSTTALECYLDDLLDPDVSDERLHIADGRMGIVRELSAILWRPTAMFALCGAITGSFIALQIAAPPVAAIFCAMADTCAEERNRTLVRISLPRRRMIALVCS